MIIRISTRLFCWTFATGDDIDEDTDSAPRMHATGGGQFERSDPEFGFNPPQPEEDR